MTREEMMQAMIEKFGFESIATIVFCTLAEDEKSDEEELKKIFEEFITW